MKKKKKSSSVPKTPVQQADVLLRMELLSLLEFDGGKMVVNDLWLTTPQYATKAHLVFYCQNTGMYENIPNNFFMSSISKVL